MNIYSILCSIEHNPHYLKKYINFICSRKETEIGESHHICPKAKDMFPQYSSFKIHPWNKIKLTEREHFIAHMLLHKTFGKSQSRAFWMMCNHRKSNSRLYKSARELHRNMMLTNNPMSNPESRKRVGRTGQDNHMWGKKGAHYGKTGELSHLYGKKRPEHSKRMSGSGNPSFGKTPNSVLCCHCHREIDVRNYSRWHGNNCRLFKNLQDDNII